jgi:predicted phage tail protein
MLRDVFLHGSLGKKYGEYYRLSVDTAGEAIRALSVNFPTFADDIKEGWWEVVRGDPEKGLFLEIDDTNSLKLGTAALHITPVPAGSKRGGIIKAVLGVALIGAALFLSGGTLAAAIGPGILSGVTYGNIAMVGVALTISGVASMLAPKEQPNTTGNNNSSFQIAATNVYDQGNPVPLVYGETICGSVVISSGLDIDPIPVQWTPVNLAPIGLGSLSGNT